MIEMTKIEVTRAEGPLDFTAYPVGKTKTVHSWAHANSILRRIAHEKRQNGETIGYDKTDFTVHFADGQTYSGRADVEADGSDTDLARHVREFVGFLAGTFRPLWMNDDQWAEACRQHEQDGSAKQASAFLATYQIG